MNDERRRQKRDGNLDGQASSISQIQVAAEGGSVPSDLRVTAPGARDDVQGDWSVQVHWSHDASTWSAPVNVARGYPAVAFKAVCPALPPF